MIANKIMSTSFYIMFIVQLVAYPPILYRLIRSLKKANKTMDKTKYSLVLSIFIISLILIIYLNYLFVKVRFGQV